MNKDLATYNQNRYQQQSSGDEQADWMYQFMELDIPLSDTDRAWRQVAIKARPLKTRRSLLPWAASVLILAIAGWTLYTQMSHPDRPQVIVRATSGVHALTLPDGSRVVLNKNARMSHFADAENGRMVSLTGEAYFDIVKESRPFIIEAGQIQVKVLGTAFNVNMRDQQVRVFVERGLVSINRQDQQFFIEPGMEAIYDGNNQSIVIDQSPPSNILSWHTGKFIFEHAPLSEVVRDLGNYYHVNFHYDEELFGNCTVNVVFNNEPLKQVIRSLGYILNADLQLRSKEVYITGNGCQ